MCWIILLWASKIMVCIFNVTSFFMRWDWMFHNSFAKYLAKTIFIFLFCDTGRWNACGIANLEIVKNINRSSLIFSFSLFYNIFILTRFIRFFNRCHCTVILKIYITHDLLHIPKKKPRKKTGCVLLILLMKKRTFPIALELTTETML